VLRRQAVAEADIAAFGRAWVQTFDAETAPCHSCHAIEGWNYQAVMPRSNAAGEETLRT